MSELYTSLTQLKISMNGGALPPMTPLTLEARAICDPEFSLGMGALVQDTEKGLRCPVRSCGRWVHSYRHHADARHADIGGSTAILRVLDIPQQVVLYSERLRATRRHNVAHLREFSRNGSRGPRTTATKAKIAATRRAIYSTVSSRNFRNRCDTQMKHIMIDMHHRLGRTPSYREAEMEPGLEGFARCATKVYGSWANALAMFGLESVRLSCRKLTCERVLAGLRAWYDMHGSLPSQRDVVKGIRLPILATCQTHTRVLGTPSWPEAMRRAAALLNIYGGRYGLPECARPEAA